MSRQFLRLIVGVWALAGWSLGQLDRAGLSLRRWEAGSELSWAELIQTGSSGQKPDVGLLVTLREEPCGQGEPGGDGITPEQDPSVLKGQVCPTRTGPPDIGAMFFKVPKSICPIHSWSIY